MLYAVLYRGDIFKQWNMIWKWNNFKSTSIYQWLTSSTNYNTLDSSS